ncbi:MAG: DUF4115 domain-containing protein [Gammaproteobacteria bacterium]|nr:MAG: DUF4115 domain-containing protein [Gammaproteobacteria bacterium]
MIENLHSDESQSNKSPGHILQQARLQAGLTQEQVAKELYMTVAKVKSLEADDYNRLSSDTFARGYIRAYANLVKADVVVALAAYDKLMEDLKPLVTTQHVSAPTVEVGQRGTWHFLIVIAAFLVGLWLISVWFFDNRTESDYPLPAATITSAQSVQVNGSVASSVTGGAFSSDSMIVAPTNVVPTGTNASASKSSEAKSADASTAVSGEVNTFSTEPQSGTNASVKKSTLDEITFSFRAECWLEVSDSRGDVLATELEPAGGKIKLLGRAPFNVKLGNAPAVDIELNGKKVDVVPLIGTNVLILKVGN